MLLPLAEVDVVVKPGLAWVVLGLGNGIDGCIILVCFRWDTLGLMDGTSEPVLEGELEAASSEGNADNLANVIGPGTRAHQRCTTVTCPWCILEQVRFVELNFRAAALALRVQNDTATGKRC